MVSFTEGPMRQHAEAVKRELTDSEFVERCRVVARCDMAITASSVMRLVQIIDKLQPPMTPEQREAMTEAVECGRLPLRKGKGERDESYPVVDLHTVDRLLRVFTEARERVALLRRLVEHGLYKGGRTR